MVWGLWFRVWGLGFGESHHAHGEVEGEEDRHEHEAEHRRPAQVFRVQSFPATALRAEKRPGEPNWYARID